MKLLVSTSNSVLAFDTSTAAAFAVDRSRGLYYGLARTPRGLVAAARRRMMSSTTSIDEERGCLIVFPIGRPSHVIESPIALRDLHGIAYCGESLLLTSTRDEKIVILRDGSWDSWRPTERPAEEATDASHINTIVTTSDGVFVMLHNFGNSEVLRFDGVAGRLLDRSQLGKQAHNIWFDNGHMRVCSSGEGRIVGNDGFLLETGGFPRGYASDGRHKIIGISETVERAARDNSIITLLHMDAAYRVIERFVLPDEGMVLDLLWIEDAEYFDLENQHRGNQANVTVEPRHPGN
jgi:hypothetical protein